MELWIDIHNLKEYKKIMANFLETGIKYVGSVVSRSLGFSAGREQLAVFSTLSADRTQEWVNRVKTQVGVRSVLEAGYQFLLPAMSRLGAAGYYMDPGIDRELYPTVAPTEPETEPERSIYQTEYIARIVGSFPVDIAQWGAVAVLSHSPVEAVAWKLAANVATHVAFDVIGAAAKRIKNVRLPTNTIIA